MYILIIITATQLHKNEIIFQNWGDGSDARATGYLADVLRSVAEHRFDGRYIKGEVDAVAACKTFIGLFSIDYA